MKKEDLNLALIAAFSLLICESTHAQEGPVEWHAKKSHSHVHGHEGASPHRVHAAGAIPGSIAARADRAIAEEVRLKDDGCGTGGCSGCNGTGCHT